MEPMFEIEYFLTSDIKVSGAIWASDNPLRAPAITVAIRQRSKKNPEQFWPKQNINAGELSTLNAVRNTLEVKSLKMMEDALLRKDEQEKQLAATFTARRDDAPNYTQTLAAYTPNRVAVDDTDDIPY